VLAPDQPGTELRPGTPVEGPIAIAGHARLAGLSMPREGDRGPAELFALLQAKRVTPRLVHGESERVSVFAPPGSGIDEVAHELSDRATALPPVASVVVVGGGANPGLDALELLDRAGLSPRLSAQGRSAASQVFLIDPEDRTEATRALHGGLFARGLAQRNRP